MKDYQEALDRLENFAYHGGEKGNNVKIIQELVNEKLEQESRKDKLIVGSEWECVAECLSERVTDGVSYTRLEDIKDSVEITKIGLGYVNYKLLKIEMILEFTMPTQQFLLCFKPIKEGSK